MKKAILIPMIALMWFSAAHATTAVVTKFSAGVGEIRIPPEADYESLKKKKQIDVKVPAILFKKPIIISDVRKAAKSAHDEINFLVEYTKVNLAGTPEDIAAFWVPEERAEKLALFKDKEVFARNRELVQESPGLHVLGIIYQKTTLSVLEPLSDTTAIGITMKKVGSKYYLTDHPTNDLELAVIEAALRGKR